jgi:hypothetical protein
MLTQRLIPAPSSPFHPLCLHIPLYFPLLPQRQIAEVRSAGAFHRDADVRRGRLAALDAIQPIADVGDGTVSAGANHDRRFDFASADTAFATFGVNGQDVAVEFHGGFGAAQFEAAVVYGGVHLAEIGGAEILGVIQHAGDGVGAFEVFEQVALSCRHRTRGRGRASVPMHDVNPVRHQIGQRAAAEIPEPAPSAVFERRNLLRGRVAKPGLLIELSVVEVFGHNAGVIVLIPPHAHGGDLAERATVYELFTKDEVFPTALLCAGLYDALAGFDGFDEWRAFFNRMSDGLFDIDILARVDGVGGHLGVPVVRAANDDGVNILVIEQCTVIAILFGVGRVLDGIAHARRIHIANGGEGHVRILLGVSHQ